MMLEVVQVSKVYEGKVPYRALHSINFKVEDGEFVGIMGPSGSGKTTLLNVISTIDAPTSGHVRIDGENPHALKQNDLAKFRRRHLGFVFQDFNLLKTLTVEENIVLSMTLDNRPVKEMKQRVEEIAETLGIKHILKKRINEISGGQMQRAAVARAIIHEPKLLLADEPTGNLDSKSSKDVMELFTLVNESFNTTILLVTHDPTAASYCDRVLFIRDGKLYSEIHKGDNRHVFFQKIIDTISLMGGNGDDLSAVRLP